MEEFIEDKAEGSQEEELVQEGWVQRVRRAFRQSVQHDPPAADVDAAKDMFRFRKERPARAIHVARLLYDSWTHLVTVSDLRDAPTAVQPDGSPGVTRHQVYATAFHDVELWGERQKDGSWYLIGQLLPKGGAEALEPQAATLIGEDKSFAAVPRDGEFHIGSVRSGSYILRLLMDRAEILVPNVAVGM